MCPGYTKTAVVATFIFLISSVFAVFAIGGTVNVRHGMISNVEYIMITNPAGQNITTKIYDSQDNVIFSSSSANTTLTYTIEQYGKYKAVVSVAGVVLPTGVFVFTMGSVINTGFTAVLQKEFGTNLFLVGITILFGVVIFGITIGRYVALPLVMATVGILSMYNFIPSWIAYLLILIAAILFAQGIYKMVATGGA